MRTFLLCLSVLLLAAPASGLVKACDQAMKDAGECNTLGASVMIFEIDPAMETDLVDSVGEQFAYPNIVCAPADVAAGRCSGGQLGLTVITPETKKQFAARMISNLLALRVYNRRVLAAEQAARAAVPLPTPPQ